MDQPPCSHSCKPCRNPSICSERLLAGPEERDRDAHPVIGAQSNS